jgi:hypothetical protein
MQLECLVNQVFRLFLFLKQWYFKLAWTLQGVNAQGCSIDRAEENAYDFINKIFLRRKIGYEKMESTRKEISVTRNAGALDLPCGTGSLSRGHSGELGGD